MASSSTNQQRLADMAPLEIDVSSSDRSLLDWSERSQSQSSLEVPKASGGVQSAIADNAAEASRDRSVRDSRRASTDSESTAPRGSVSFGAARNLRTGSMVAPAAGREAGEPVATPVAYGRSGDDDSDTASYEVGHGAAALRSTQGTSFSYRPNASQPKTKGVLKNSAPGPIREVPAAPSSDKKTKRDKSARLSVISQKYDLDGNGKLDAIEQAMRDRDIDGDGNLDTAEVYAIVQDQLKSQTDYKKYRKAAMGVFVLVVILALSNFGTSWATAMLSKETQAQPESGAIESVVTGEVVGMQDMAETIDLVPLEEAEFEERRRLVEAEMEADPDHPDHRHRKLGRKNNKHKCSCSKVAYDHGKIDERALERIVTKCDGANTVNIRRSWRADVMEAMEYEYDYDYDTICSPGTQVQKKQKKKRNKGNTKTKNVLEGVTFKNKGKDGRNRDVTFSCKGGKCYSSGNALLQKAGHPCELAFDYDGASECDEGLVCYHPDATKRRGVGTCTRLQKYARFEQVCSYDLGVDACEAGYACVTSDSWGNTKKIKVGTIRTGLCTQVGRRVALGDVCDVSYGKDACVAGDCLGANGRSLKKGLGVCARSARSSSAVVEYRTIKKRAGYRQACRYDYGVDACDMDYVCYSSNGKYVKYVKGKQDTGICQNIARRAGYMEWCDASYGNGACAGGYDCWVDGRAASRGIGVCEGTSYISGRNNGNNGSGGWHVDYSRGSEGQCVQGRTDFWEEDETYPSAGECCEQKLWWMGKGQCAPSFF